MTCLFILIVDVWIDTLTFAATEALWHIRNDYLLPK